MLKFYDRICNTCGTVDVDVMAESTADLAVPCDCGGLKGWSPSYGVGDKHDPFYDPAFDRTFSTYREMEAHAKSVGCVVMTPSEHENLHEGRRKDDTKLRELTQKNYYRLQHGYRDRPDPRS